MAREWLQRRRGFSLVELLIAMVIGVILGTAMVRIVLTQSQFVSAQRLSSESRVSAASGLGLLQSELRMIEVRRDLSSSITTANDSVLEFRMPMAVGVLCDATTALVQPYDSTRQTMSGLGATQFSGYAVRQLTWAYEYREVGVSGWLTMPGPSLACSAPPRFNQLPGHQIATFPLFPVPGYTASQKGTPIVLWNRLRYRFAGSTTFTGRRALYRVMQGPGAADSIEFLAPLDTGARFRYFDIGDVDAPRVTPPTLLRIVGVQVTIPGMSQSRVANRPPETTRLAASVFFRNSQ
ncbi:MAG: prepilin-type N-terminal cleavage/methylation domain-containing protein [Gemmatimonadaceae bacterium]|nr:prepilin-type N-terminal cleavage/methylation domain-containing protein [Gemmatimonadaceae bacterium]